MKAFSEVLAHAGAAFTMATYSHIMTGMQSDAMALLDEGLLAGKNGVPGEMCAKPTPTRKIMVSSN